MGAVDHNPRRSTRCVVQSSNGNPRTETRNFFRPLLYFNTAAVDGKLLLLYDEAINTNKEHRAHMQKNWYFEVAFFLLFSHLA